MSEKREWALEVRELAKCFHEGGRTVRVLDGIDLRVERGEFAAIMGPSGSGKSTLLHLVAGLLSCDRGSIIVGGEDISAMTDAAVTRFRRGRIGLVFQDFNLIPTLSVAENIVLPLLLGGIHPDAARLDKLLGQFGLAERRNHLPLNLSGGERQRAAIARALFGEPEIVLADEPTGNLDSPAGRAFCDLLRQMNRDHGITILLVSHDPVVAATARKVYLLNDGRFVDSFETAHDAGVVAQRYLQMARPA